MADFPIASYQFEDDPPTVTVTLGLMLSALEGTPEWDGTTLELTPDRADELAAALRSKASDARAGRIDFSFTEDDDS